MTSTLPTQGASLKAERISFGYDQRKVLDGASLTLNRGEILALLGCNGAGKSTLLKIMLGLLPPDQGEVTLNGRLLRSYTRRELASRLAYVPQVHAVPFPYSVLEIVLMGRLPANGWMGAPSKADVQLAYEILQRFDVADLAQRPYTEISGGQRQLALIARAMIQGARTLVLDEPMNGLDYGRQILLMQHLRSLAQDGYAVLLTTHHPEHALQCATRAAVLIDGKITLDGVPASVITAEAIRRLYGVEVKAFSSPEGAVAFQPRL